MPAESEPSLEPMKWYPTRLLSPKTRGWQATASPSEDQGRTTAGSDVSSSRLPTSPYALLILNQPVNKAALGALLPNASLLICADAGGDKYREYYDQVRREREQQHDQTNNDVSARRLDKGDTDTIQLGQNGTASDNGDIVPRLPDAIVGDLDSLSDKSRQYWSQLGVPIVHDPDQYSTDFTKCLKWLRQNYRPEVGQAEDLQQQQQLRTEEGKEGNSTTRLNPDETSNTDDTSIHHTATNHISRDHTSTDHTSADHIATDQTSTDQTPTDTTGADTTTSKDSTAADTPSSPPSSAATPQSQTLDVLVLGSLGGRVDQGFSLIHHLLYASTTPTLLQGEIYLISEQSLSFVLHQGQNEIYIDDWPDPHAQTQPQPQINENSGKGGETFRENIGIIPLTGLSHITTHGLEWDVDYWPTVLGGQVSTSNHIRRPKVEVYIHGGNRCLFTIELAERLCL